MQFQLILVALSLAHAADPYTVCENKCATAGHCCQGSTSACQKPSCAMGCQAVVSAKLSEAACNASCVSAAKQYEASPFRNLTSGGCAYRVPHSNLTWQMCGVCRAQPAPAWWPAAAKPLNGQHPGFWPPGYSLPDCSSCGAVDGDQVGECKLGCVYASQTGVKPIPPAPPMPPAARGAAPACGVFPAADQPGFSPCQIGADVNFSTVFSDHAVLQMEPAQAAVYGYLGTNAKAGSKVTVTVTSSSPSSSAASFTVDATVDVAGGKWKALLKPTSAGSSYTVLATCRNGCTGSARLADVTFGDVWCVRV